ncbi:MAG TPA: hypothetical protein VL123_09200 [Candidatus Udaeobacter sp.]|nr:hypothetical protein [Candidatus Udaeobacter sp.]
MRLVRALSRALVGLIAIAGPALSGPTDPDTLGGRTSDTISDTDLPRWWSEPGWPGFTPNAGLGTAFAWTLAGHSIGGWSLTGAELPPAIPWPSLDEARRALVWSDSVRVGAESDAGWQGPGAALANAASLHVATRKVRARSVFRLETGEFGLDRYALAVERGDSLRWIRIETTSGHRDAFGAMGRGGDHAWDLVGAWTRGAHRLSGSIGQRGAAQELSHAAVSEDAGGQSGNAAYEWRRDGRRLSLAFARGLDHREDIIDVPGLFSFSRREAQENRFDAEAETPWAGGTVAARGWWSRSRVVRTYDDAFDARTTTWWGAGAFDHGAGDGRLRLSLGGGHSSALARDLFAPSASLSFATGAARGRVFAERLLHPVWSDLAPGQSAFLQHTDAFGIEAGASTRRLRGETSVLTGITHDRAIVFPYPIEDIWLRAGATAETRRFGFALLTASARATTRHFELTASGFALARDQDASEPRVEPDAGMRIYGENRFSAFQNDLFVRLRVEGDAVGARESKTGGVDEPIPAFWTSGASVIVTLADATLILRASNLENEKRPEPWVDPGTGLLARGPGRAIRFTFTWRLFD